MNDKEFIVNKIKIRACNFYQNMLWQPPGKKARAYLIRRGVNFDTAKSLSIGYAPGEQSLRQHLEAMGLDISLALDSGLLRFDKNMNISDFFNDYIIFPIFQGSDIRTFTGRKVTTDPEERMKHLHLKRAQKQLYNYNIIEKSNVVMLVESPFNAISLIQWDYPAVATLGANSFNKAHAKLFSKKVIYIIYDNDENKSGQRAALKTAKILFSEEKINPYIVTMPVGVDINDYYLSHEKKDFMLEILSTKRRLTDIPEFKRWMIEETRKAFRPKYKVTKNTEDIALVQTIPIADIVRLFQISMTKYGDDYKAICPLPMHREKISSFTVYTQTNTIKCFGCGFFGDGIDFVMQMKNIGFIEAIKFLKGKFFLTHGKEKTNGYAGTEV